MLCLLVIYLWPLSSQAQSPQFETCDRYDVYIERAVRRHWPTDFQRPEALKAQMYQESLCQPSAISPAGARGLMQFMPRTWEEMRSIFGGNYSPHGHKAIEWGAYYQNRQMRVWRRRGRSLEEQWPLGLAGYNAGTGNILKAQALCSNARLWPDINPCLRLITGHHASETTTYVARIRHWRTALEKEVHNGCNH